MTNGAARGLRRTFVTLGLCTVTIFAALFFGLTGVLRGRLRAEIEQRDAEAIHAVARMQIDAAQSRLAKLGVPFSTTDVFAAVLESSRLRGVISVQLFDRAGNLHDAMPAMPREGSRADRWWPQRLESPVAQYHAAGTLEEALGVTDTEGASTLPLLEVVVPLGSRRTGGELGAARYWIEGGEIAAEFRRLDQRLFGEAAAACVGGSLVVVLLLAWAYQRLAAAQRRIEEKSLDLARANQELDFAAKTGALGAISAHLVHGLKNPLAGLEDFVTEVAADDTAAMPGAARQSAIETARRLRALVNEVIGVLRDEAAGTTDYPVMLDEVLQAVETRAKPHALSRGVILQATGHQRAELPARTANLAGLVLANLLTNAIDATPRNGSVKLDAEIEDGNIRFLVTDTGPGLPDEVRRSLFVPVKSSKPGGSGMGLAISARLARHAGGDLTLVRTEASGTTFKLMVPARR